MTNRCAEWPAPCEHTRPFAYLSIAFSSFSPFSSSFSSVGIQRRTYRRSLSFSLSFSTSSIFLRARASSIFVSFFLLLSTAVLFLADLLFSSPLSLSSSFFSFLSLFFFEAVTLIAEAFGRYSFEVFLGRVPRNPFDTPFPTPRRMLPLPFDPRMEFFHHPPVCHPILIRRNFIKFPSIDV